MFHKRLLKEFSDNRKYVAGMVKMCIRDRLEDHVLAEIRLPSLTERPLLERRKLLEHFLVAEACRTKRTICLLYTSRCV